MKHSIGIVGTGATVSIAHYHALGYKADGRCSVDAVYDVNREAAGKWVEDHDLHATVCASYEELLSRVDTVDLCVPNFLHHPYALAALKADKNVFVEKPLATTVQDCRELEMLALASKRCARVGFVYRYADTIQLARRIVSERLGLIYSLSAWFGGKRLANPQIPLEWRMLKAKSRTGALDDFGSHLVDIAGFVAGQVYETVSCSLSTCISERLDPATGKMGMVENDDVAVMLGKSGTSLGTFSMSRVGMDDVMLLIVGEGGMLQVSLRAPESLLFWEKERNGAYKGSCVPCPVTTQKPFEGWFLSEMRGFIDAIEGDVGLGATISQGLYVEKVLFAAEQAALSAREVRV